LKSEFLDSPPTISAGIKEPNNPKPPPIGKSRKKGGGRKTTTNQPTILNALKTLIEPHPKTTPHALTYGPTKARVTSKKT